MTRNCLLCGVGGQGVVLASRLIAYAAMEQGDFVRTTETIGMAQRGGSVVRKRTRDHQQPDRQTGDIKSVRRELQRTGHDPVSSGEDR